MSSGSWYRSQGLAAKITIAAGVVFLLLVVWALLASMLRAETPREGVIIYLGSSVLDELLPYRVVVEGSDGRAYQWNVSAYDAAGYYLGMTIPIAERAWDDGTYPEFYRELSDLSR